MLYQSLEEETDMKLLEERIQKDGIVREGNVLLWEEFRDEFKKDFWRSLPLGLLFGGLLFLGILLSVVFLFGTVLIMYYKQISEGYDDKARYEIMEKVGMSNDEVKKSITSQVRMVFFLPIILAACHLAAAFPLLRRLLVMFNLTDIKLIAICMSATFLVFVAIYYIVFKITSRAYYRIVAVSYTHLTLPTTPYV